MRLFSFDYERYLFSFFLIVERPNLIVLEYMANGALDKYLQVKSEKHKHVSCKIIYFKSLPQHKENQEN